jgi:hypothetical protein
MILRIGHTSYVIDFLGVDFRTDEVSNTLHDEFTGFLSTFDNDKNINWEVMFRATYTNSRKLLVSKNKLGTYPSDKTKEIIIAIPIPLLDDVTWGVSPEQHAFKIDHYDKLINNFWELDVDFKVYNNRTDYILECMRRGIIETFERGFTVGGIKIQSSYNQFTSY